MFIDLRSDTVTKPTPDMLKAMMNATVGDDVFGEDPMVCQLEEKMAGIFGKEAGVFCPSGTMSNQIGILLHTRPGDEVICHRESHVYKYEGGGFAVNAHCSIKLLDGIAGKIDAASICSNVNPDDVHFPVSRLVCLEDTTNRGGGAFYNLHDIKDIQTTCRELGLALHLDGARVFNALVETKVDRQIYGSSFDTISVCLSKGLGAPVGSVLLGTAEHIKKARRIRKVLGGGMRQAGYLAAAGIYALDHHIDRLKEDHQRAQSIAACLQECSFVEQVLPVSTNIIIFRVAPPFDETSVVSKLRTKGIQVLPFGPSLVRMVTHLGIDDAMLKRVNIELPSLFST